jgi:DNA-binding NarL/FixJ family response regulator
MEAVRVLVVDDNFLLREGLLRLLTDDPRTEVVGAADDLAGGLAYLDDHPPDVIITDVRMPPSHTDEGIRLAAEARIRHPQVGVVVLSAYADASYAVRLMADGSQGRGYLLKERVADQDQLVQAVSTVASGGSVLDPMIVDAMLSARAQRKGALDALTRRERQVLAAIACGSSNRAVAAGLLLSPRSVEKHINAIFAKLGLTGDPTLDQRVKATLLFLADANA